MNCRNCNSKLSNVFCDLVTCPPSNAMLLVDDLNSPEKYFPLKVFVCDSCWLVQVDELEKAEDIFNDKYTYFSSFSSSWLYHAKNYVNKVTEQFNLNNSSLVVEIASNDGYLLQYFKEKGIPAIGVEPTANTAKVAIEKGIETWIEFFNSNMASNKLAQKVDLILGNNVLAHLPDINDFVKGVKISLKKDGFCTFEFPHLCKLVEENQFDTIYHEHFSYLSFIAVETIFEKNGLVIFDVEELATHGGSLRIYAKNKENKPKQISINVAAIKKKEKQLGVDSISYYLNFQTRVNNVRDTFLTFLIEQKKLGKKVVGYGAAAKGNTLLNYAGVKGSDLIKFVVDASIYKQDKFLPGSRIPVYSPEKIREEKPDWVIIFPWNLKVEISSRLNFIKDWGGQFVTFIPDKHIF
jgi:SAM-dependent methyltransferase